MKASWVLGMTLSVLVISGCGNRSPGNKVEDQFLPSRVSESISQANPQLKGGQSHVVVTAYNGVVLLAGQVPNQQLKTLAGQAASRTAHVDKVYNELQIQAPTSLMVRSADSVVTTKVKSEMLITKGLPSTKIKVVTENGIVFLMGVLTRKEGNIAASAAQSISGVQKVVKLFQYIN